MVEVLRAAVLGLVQGLTEFIPVSSSAHLVLVPYLASWPTPGLAFDVALHMGTLVAVIVYFRAELAAIVRGLLGLDRSVEGLLYRRLGFAILVATIPVGLVGLIFEDEITAAFESPLASAIQLLFNAGILVLAELIRDRRVGSTSPAPALTAEQPPAWAGDWIGGEPGVVADFERPEPGRRLPIGEDEEDPRGRSLEGVNLGTAAQIGVAQVVSLIPGISRSGATIAAGLFAGLTREAATRFSFLLSLPALLGAGLLSIDGITEPGVYSGTATLVGMFTALVSGYLAIRFLVALVARDRLTGFARYCVLAAIVGIVGYLMIGPPSTV